MRRLIIGIVMAICAGILYAQDVFTTKGTQLTDATGQPFVIAGVNNPHAWFGNRAYQALDDIAATGANTVRIVWDTSGRADQLERIITRCIALKMIPMVELHDVTGNTSGERLLDMARYFTRDDIKAVLTRHERYLLINIANEWGDHAVSSQYWLQSYHAAVTAMRQAGFTTTLVVDAPGWGQNIQPILERGSELLDKDPLHNILFSIHMYGSWNNPQDITDKLSAAKEKNLPLIVGEFGYNSNDGKNNLGCKVDHRTIMKTCNGLGYGFLAWSWTGNNEENAWLDLVESRDWKTLTPWGREVIDGPYGIRQTARPANVFNGKALKPRVVVLTDIGRPDLEPDDTESLVHLLCYADQLEIEGIITSTGWNCDPYPDESAAYRDSVVEAYAADVHNLMKRSAQQSFAGINQENGRQETGYWPSAAYIRSRCVMGSRRAGIGVIGSDNDSEGSELIIRLADEQDERPIWVCAWGGANTLAQAVWKVKQTRTAEQLKTFLRKLRLYTITDQDMVYAMRMNLAYSSHQWMRREFADDLKFVWDEGTWQLQCSLGQEYWQQIKNQIQGHAALGRQYPNYKYGVEGDTPSFLNVIPNGLHNPEEPMQAGWGGYHTWALTKDSTTYAWTSWQEPVKSISEAYYRQFYPAQLNDFIARMEWAETGRGNHNPVAIVNGKKGSDAVVIKAKAGQTVTLDASASFDPDGDALSFGWWQQKGIGQTSVEIADAQSATIKVQVPATDDEIHIICEVRDNGKHPLTAYRRIIINPKTVR